MRGSPRTMGSMAWRTEKPPKVFIFILFVVHVCIHSPVHTCVHGGQRLTPACSSFS